MNVQDHSVIGAIYDAAVAPSRWRHALDQVAGLAGAKAMALVIQDDPTGGRNRTLLSSPYLEYSRTLRGMYYGAVLDRHQNEDWTRLARRAPLQVVPDTEAFSDVQALDRRPDYRALTKALGVCRRVGVRLSADRVWFDAASMGYAQRDPVAAGHWGNAIDVLPHLSRAVEISRMFFRLQRSYKAALAALDHVDLALAIARADGQLISVNARAEQLLQHGDGVRRAPEGRLRCEDAQSDAELSRAIAQAGATAQGSGADNRVPISVARSGDAQPLLVEVAPLRDSTAELEPGLIGALVTLIDPEQMPDLHIDRFARAYDLTQAEAEVCALVVQGLGTSEIAERRNTVPVTVKNQIGSILSKTGVHRRTELLRLVLRVLPPVR